MGYKKMDQKFGFAPVRSSGPTGQADLALESSLKHNRSLKTIEKLGNLCKAPFFAQFLRMPRGILEILNVFLPVP